MLNSGQTDCRMLQGEHSAILTTFIKLPVVIKTFVLFFLSGRFIHVSCIVVKGGKVNIVNADQTAAWMKA